MLSEQSGLFLVLVGVEFLEFGVPGKWLLTDFTILAFQGICLIIISHIVVVLVNRVLINASVNWRPQVRKRNHPQKPVMNNHNYHNDDKRQLPDNPVALTISQVSWFYGDINLGDGSLWRYRISFKRMNSFYANFQRIQLQQSSQSDLNFQQGKPEA